MEFEVQKRGKMNKEKYHKEHFDIAYKFAEKAFKEFGTFVKAIILFGSATRKEAPEGDIDILIVVDDLSVVLRPEVVQTYRILTQKIIGNISPRLHITTLKLTSFWEYAKAGDPVAVNMLRDGVALIDTGFFEPLQMLLRHGRIRPSPESIWSYFVRAPATLQNSKWHLLQGTLDLYWAVIDAAHAALMKIGEVPPSPEHVADMLHERLVKNKLLHSRYPKMMNEFFHVMKAITHREVREIHGKQYDEYYKKAEEFVRVMKKLIESDVGSKHK
jgi:predicted nucleotidyltransferase/uncharacterized protein (UPF0332 family)